MTFLVKLMKYEKDDTLSVIEVKTTSIREAIDKVISSDARLADIFEDDDLVLFMRSELGVGLEWFVDPADDIFGINKNL